MDIATISKSIFEGLSGRRQSTLLAIAAITVPLALTPACSGDSQQPSTTATASATGSGGATAGTGGATGEGGATAGTGGTAAASTTTTGAGGAGGTPVVDPGPMVDLTDPQLYGINFKASDADPAAKTKLGVQPAYLDTRVTPLGILVVHLHGAGAPSTCGGAEHEKLLAGFGFHTFGPCYTADYGIENCGQDIEGCRMEAFEGVDHTAVITVTPPESIETRIVKGLLYLQSKNPKGDWKYFLDGDKPRWSKIIISGHSHGASSAGVIGLHRVVNRVVSLSGPRDVNQPWLKKTPLTAIDLFYGFTHTADPQHAEHLAAFESLMLPGKPISVDTATPPFSGSHRLETSIATNDGHGSTLAGGSSPKVGGKYVFEPVWKYLYTSAP